MRLSDKDSFVVGAPSPPAPLPQAGEGRCIAVGQFPSAERWKVSHGLIDGKKVPAIGWLAVAVFVAIWMSLFPEIVWRRSISSACRSCEMQVTVEPDASVRIVYDITFQNNPSGHAIDMVDIGMPHAATTCSNVRASIDGGRLPTSAPRLR